VAMLSVNRYRIRNRAARGERSARALEALLAKPDDWLGANLIVLTLASAGVTTIATILAVRSGHRYALLLPTLGVPTLMLVFCELAPKIFAAAHADRVALSAARSYRLLVALARPGVGLANSAAYGLLRLFGVVQGDARGDSTLSADELRTVVAESGPLVPARHRQMLLSILDLERATVNDIMIPRQEIAGIDLDDDWDQILGQLRSTPHTRLPVYKGDIDNMVGLLHMKRVAQELARGTLDHERLEEVARAREPYFVPEGASLAVQLANFQRHRRRFGFVVDEYGDVMGLVTLEDLLEEIVGEFTSDPATATHRDVMREPGGSLIINASATNRALNRALGWTLPTNGPKTLNGLLLEQLGTIPPAGTVLRVGTHEFEVMQIADNAIRTVRVREVRDA
ncbi:MAG: CNNM domain-containing protein, partial [Burkholderiales bacterium]|nr:CNNM domain-containing protein [Burkholderiales bacterium]